MKWAPRSPIGVVALLVVLAWAAAALLAPVLAPYPPGRIVTRDSLAQISVAFPLGTDYLGRDMLSRVLFGARYTLGIPLLSASLACAMGVALGLTAAARGGWFDMVTSRVLDAMISVPSLLAALVVVSALGSSIKVLILMAAVIYVPGAYRLSRAMAVNINAMDFVAVARARGERTLYIVWAELLPNMILPVLTDFGLRFVFVVLLLTGMSFLGLGIQPPDADWGTLVRENLEGLSFGAPAVIMPALAIATLTVSVNALIDHLPGIRPAEDVR
jgi:peptide/nickel transport system permease protein